MSLIKVGVRKRRRGVREPAIVARYWTKKAPASLVGKEYLGTTSIGTYPHAVSGWLVLLQLRRGRISLLQYVIASGLSPHY